MNIVTQISEPLLHFMTLSNLPPYGQFLAWAFAIIIGCFAYRQIIKSLFFTFGENAMKEFFNKYKYHIFAFCGGFIVGGFVTQLGFFA